MDRTEGFEFKIFNASNHFLVIVSEFSDVCADKIYFLFNRRKPRLHSVESLTDFLKVFINFLKLSANFLKSFPHHNGEVVNGY